MAKAGTVVVGLRPGKTEPPAVLAGRILAAATSGDLAGLEAGLERAESAEWHACTCSGATERVELLSAVAARMLHAIRDFRRELAPPLAGVEIHLRLLEHLART